MTARKNETPEERAARAEYQKAYREANRDRLRAYDQMRFQRDKEKNRADRRERWRDWYYQHQSRLQVSYREKAIKYRTKLRLEVLQAYSLGNAPECACCGELHMEFLCLDHINDDGAEHRKEVMGERGKRYGTDYMYRWARNNKYPPIFQVLCHNCNQARGWYGYCPHLREETE